MPYQVCTGALLRCSCGAAPATFQATPRPVLSSRRIAGVIADHTPFLNVPPFGMCNSPANPQVIAATAAALGVPTPAPCQPVLPAPWVPGAPTVFIGGIPALDDSCRLPCAWAGVITVGYAGQASHHIP